jgi:ketosteroid isomerase-like protein
MHKISVALALGLVMLTAGSALASETTDVIATVHQFVDGFNKGDAKSALAACADQTSIVDEFPPYAWDGAGACSKWANDYEADARKNGITDGVVTLDKPRHVEVTGDRAYVVFPTSYAYKQNGKAMKEAHSTFTLVLQKGSSGWRITAWAWAKQ